MASPTGAYARAVETDIWAWRGLVLARADLAAHRLPLTHADPPPGRSDRRSLILEYIRDLPEFEREPERPSPRRRIICRHAFSETRLPR